MATKNGNKPDVTETPEPPKEPEVKTFEVTVSWPPTLTRRHWNIYYNAKQSYINAERKENRLVSEAMARSIGGLAILVAGIVHFDGWPMQPNWAAMAADEDADLMLLGIVDTLVSIPIEVELNRPLSAFFDKSLGTRTLVNISTVHQP